MPLPPSRQYFGIGTKPTEDYFAPVVPGLAPSTGAKADLFMQNRMLDQIANQYAMQDEQQAQLRDRMEQGQRQRAFGQRMQQKIGPEIEDQTINSYRQKFATTADQMQGMKQKKQFLDAAASVDITSPEGQTQLEKLATQNPYAMSDPDVQHYLRIRGYQPQAPQQRQLSDYVESLAPDEKKYAEGAKSLPALKAQIEHARKQQAAAQQLTGMGVDPKDIENLKDESGVFDPLKVGEAMHKAKLASYDRPMTEKEKKAELNGLVRSLSSIISREDKLEFSDDETAKTVNENIKSHLLNRIKELSGEDLGGKKSPEPESSGESAAKEFKVTDKTTKEEIAKLPVGTKVVMPDGAVKYRK